MPVDLRPHRGRLIRLGLLGLGLAVLILVVTGVASAVLEDPLTVLGIGIAASSIPGSIGFVLLLVGLFVRRA